MFRLTCSSSYHSSVAFIHQPTLPLKLCLTLDSQVHCGIFVASRNLHKQRLSNSLTLMSNTTCNSSGSKAPPKLCIMLAWLLSKPEHVSKYAKLYLDQDIDVLHVNCSPLQLLWPTRGSQVIGQSILDFAKANPQYKSTVIHGFSVGAYVWGETLVHMKDKPEVYGFMRGRVTAQVWDSLVDVEGTVVGVGDAVFPSNRVLRSMLQALVGLYMKVLERPVTRYYKRASVAYEYDYVRCPTLLYCSKDDTIAIYSTVKRVADRWERDGNYVRLKSWERSGHAEHMRRYPEEYLDELKAFLERVQMLKCPDKLDPRRMKESRQ